MEKIHFRGPRSREWDEKLTVVIAEDDEDDITLLENALEEIACEHTVRIVRDGKLGEPIHPSG